MNALFSLLQNGTIFRKEIYHRNSNFSVLAFEYCSFFNMHVTI